MEIDPETCKEKQVSWFGTQFFDMICRYTMFFEDKEQIPQLKIDSCFLQSGPLPVTTGIYIYNYNLRNPYK